MTHASIDDRLAGFLSEAFGRRVRIESLTRVEGGWSRETSKVAVTFDGGVRRTLAFRGEVPASVLDTPLAREEAVLRSLAGSGVPLPALHAFESTGTVLGQPFLVVDWVDGTCVNVWRRGAAESLGDEQQRASLAWSWIDDIARLHGVDVAPLQAMGIDPEIDASSYVTAEVAHWTGVIRSATRHPGRLVEEICCWLENHRPAGSADTTLVHGDLRLGNMIVRDGHVAAFLDWEMSGVGDWRADIGYCVMPYCAGKLLEPVPATSNLLVHPRDFVDRYLDTAGRDLTEDELRWFVVLGSTKMIAIFCTGIDAVVEGRTTDPRLAWTSIAVPGLVDDACRIIDGGLPW